jgi:hypothetical protein
MTKYIWERTRWPEMTFDARKLPAFERWLQDLAVRTAIFSMV